MNKSSILKQYLKIKQFRKKHLGPVDISGAYNHFNSKSPNREDEKFMLMISLLLSVQTNDSITDLVVKSLKEKNITKEIFSKLEQPFIKELIAPVNFSNKKAAYIEQIAREFKDKPLPEEFLKKHSKFGED